MRISFLFLVVAAAAAFVLHGADAAEFIVGGTTGWQVPPNPNFYENWTRAQNLTVGDVLVFNFATGAHNVAGVTEDAFNSCSTANTLFLNSTGPFRFTLTNDEDHYFICAVPTHCGRGQKLAITEIKDAPPGGPPGTPATPGTPGTPATPTTPGTGGPTPPSGSPTTPTTPAAASPPPPPNGASTLASGFTLVFISIGVALLFNH